jgi:hypothetical protein
VSDRRTEDAKLIEAVRILSRTIQTDDGVIGACLVEAATRLKELVEERRSISTLLQKVESLEEEITRLREERRWVPVGERLPLVQGEDVLTAIQFDDGSHDINLSWWNGECWMFYGAHVPGGPCTHWMPLPPGPEGHG